MKKIYLFKVCLALFGASLFFASCQQSSGDSGSSGTQTTNSSSNSESSSSSETTASNSFDGKSFSYESRDMEVTLSFKSKTGTIKLVYYDSDNVKQTSSWTFDYTEKSSGYAEGMTEYGNDIDCWFTIVGASITVDFALYDKKGNYYSWFSNKMS